MNWLQTQLYLTESVEERLFKSGPDMQMFSQQHVQFAGMLAGMRTRSTCW